MRRLEHSLRRGSAWWCLCVLSLLGARVLEASTNGIVLLPNDSFPVKLSLQPPPPMTNDIAPMLITTRCNPPGIAYADPSSFSITPTGVQDVTIHHGSGAGDGMLEFVNANGVVVHAVDVRSVSVSAQVFDGGSGAAGLPRALTGGAQNLSSSSFGVGVSVWPPDIKYDVTTDKTTIDPEGDGAFYFEGDGCTSHWYSVSILGVTVASGSTPERSGCSCYWSDCNCAYPRPCSCSLSPASPGNGNVENKCFRFSVSLGALGVKESAGVLMMTAEKAPFAVSQAQLKFYLPPGDERVSPPQTNATGSVDIDVGNDLRARISPTNYGFSIWFPTESVTWTITNPDGDMNRIEAIKREGVRDVVVERAMGQWDGTKGDWTIYRGAEGSDQLQECRSTATNGCWVIETNTTFDSTSQLVAKSVDVMQHYPFGDRRVSHEVFYSPTNNTSLKTQWDYDDNGSVVSERLPDGGWFVRQYDSLGRVTNEVSCWTNAPFGSTADSAQVTESSYEPVGGSDNGSVEGWKPRTVVKRVMGTVVSKTYYEIYTNADDNIVVIEEKASPPSTAYGSAQNLRTITEYVGSNCTSCGAADSIKSSIFPDGRMDEYEYSTNSGGVRCTTVSHGICVAGALEMLPGLSTIDVTVQTNFFYTILRATSVYFGPTDTQVIERVTTEYDSLNREVRSDFLDGTFTTTTWNDFGGKCLETDRQGLVTTNRYDPLTQRYLSRTQVGVGGQADLIASSRYDALGRTTQTVTEAGALAQTTSSGYDMAGRLLYSVDAASVTTRYEYATNSYGGRMETGRYADGKVEVRSYCRDGRLWGISGTGVVRQVYEYGVNPDGTQWTEVHSGPAGAASASWVRTTQDSLGRTILEEKSGYSVVGGPLAVLTNTYVYNVQGQLIRSTRPSTPDTLYSYGPMGALIAQCEDLDGSSTWDAAVDLITSNVTRYVRDNGDCWQETRQQTVGIGATVTRRRLTGLSANLMEETVVVDADGNTNRTWTSVDVATTTVIRGQETADSTNAALAVSVGGVSSYAVSKTGVRTAYSNDALRRPIGTELRGGDRVVGNTRDYNGRGQVEQERDGLGNPTSYAFDAAGRQIGVTNALGVGAAYSYDAWGHQTSILGDAVNPVAFEYDAFGRMARMTTYPKGLEDAVSYDYLPLTDWKYDVASGLVTNKSYSLNADAIAYTYTADGKLASRTWMSASGAETRRTDYGYDLVGRLTNVAYADETPSVFEYDKLGRMTMASNAAACYRYAYDAGSSRVTQEVVRLVGANGPMIETITRHYDAANVKGRSTGYSLDCGLTVSYGYDGMGRFNQVRAVGADSVANQWDYRYVPGFDLVAGYTTAVIQVTRQYEPRRDLLTRVTTEAGAVTVADGQYTNNALGQRVRVDWAGAALGAESSDRVDYGYDARSELVTAQGYREGETQLARRFGYAYDLNGNRLSSTSGEAVVTYDTGEELWDGVWCYWYSTWDQYRGITNAAEGYRAFSYDVAGNLTNDGLRAYGWDAENRLTSVTPLAPTPQTAKVTFAYDHQSRRVGKQVYTWSSGSWVLSSDSHFIYDGWNMISEISNVGSQIATNMYIWGLDLSGTLQGAGGIGGLLCNLRSSVSDTSCVLYTHDANGNVTDLVDTNGAVVAHYEYSPFGETIAATGPAATSNPFRFSTKYTDDETRLLYYGYRYYSPSLGRWLSRDPIGEQGGLNLLTFCANGPINNADPRGESIEGYALIVVVTLTTAVIVHNAVIGIQKTARRTAAKKLVSDAINANEKCSGVVQGSVTLELSQNALDVATQGYSLEHATAVAQYYCSPDHKNVTIAVWGNATAQKNGTRTVVTSPWSLIDEWTSACDACCSCR